MEVCGVSAIPSSVSSWLRGNDQKVWVLTEATSRINLTGRFRYKCSSAIANRHTSSPL